MSYSLQAVTTLASLYSSFSANKKSESLSLEFFGNSYDLCAKLAYKSITSGKFTHILESAAIYSILKSSTSGKL